MKTGDQVKWMKVVRRGRSIHFNTKYGTIEMMGDHDALIKVKGSAVRVNVKLLELVPHSEPSPVLRVFQALTEDAK